MSAWLEPTQIHPTTDRRGFEYGYTRTLARHLIGGQHRLRKLPRCRFPVSLRPLEVPAHETTALADPALQALRYCPCPTSNFH